MSINGPALISLSAGSLLVYAGITGKSIPAVLRTLAQGANPKSDQVSNPISGTVLTSPAGGTITAQGGNPSGSDAANQALGKLLAATYGWATGQEWTALNNIVMAESGWSATVVNPQSGAAGIAQKISGFSSDYQEGNAPQQIRWLLNYVKTRYGDPIAAWNFHLANGWY